MNAADWYRQGVHHAERFRFDEALQALERSAELGGGPEALSVLSAVRGELGDSEGAAEALTRARALRPDDPAVALLDATLLPMVYRDGADLERWRARYAERLAAFVRDLDGYRGQAHRVPGLAKANFLLAYQGRDDLDLQRQLGGALASLLRTACPRYFEPRKRAARAKIRVGFASAFLFDCTVGRYFASWIEGLDPAKFEVAAFMTGAAADAFTDRLSRSCRALERVNLPVLDVAERIAQSDLDVLVYPEIGMDPRCRLLSCLRLAPVQLAAWGHPETTGSPEIDGFISCAEMEVPGAASHYSERLHLLPGLGVRYEAPPTPPPLERSKLGLDPGQRVYGCPHSLFKLHPDTDALFAEILERDPDGVVVLFQGQNAGPELARRVADRFAAALAARGVPPRKQLRVFPRLSPADFRRALQAMDVLVDPLHWSGGNTALDALAMGVPVVTVPGTQMRSRQAAAMLERMGARECVAGSAAHAAEAAVRIARDPAARSALSARIVAAKGRVFDDAEPVNRLQGLLGELAARS